MAISQKRYLIRATINDDKTEVFVVSSDNQMDATETARQKFPNATQIITRRLYNPSLDNDKCYEQQQDPCNNNY